MQQVQPSLIARDDTMLGVCEALGQDFRFNPTWLRAALGVLFLLNPVAALGAYGAAGVAVFTSRLLIPDPRIVLAPERDAEPEPVAAEEAAEAEPLPMAA